MLIERSASRFFGRPILVFHFPAVVHGVKGSVSNQESELLGLRVGLRIAPCFFCVVMLFITTRICPWGKIEVLPDAA